MVVGVRVQLDSQAMVRPQHVELPHDGLARAERALAQLGHRPVDPTGGHDLLTDGERIVSYFGSCGLFCYDLDGNELWKFEMPPAATIADFGTGVSPVLADGIVILLRDETKDPKIVALDVVTGKLRWERKRESRSGFSTPVVWDTPEGKYVAAPGYGRLLQFGRSDCEARRELAAADHLPRDDSRRSHKSFPARGNVAVGPGLDMRLV
jgi:hypothetical protein